MCNCGSNGQDQDLDSVSCSSSLFKFWRSAVLPKDKEKELNQSILKAFVSDIADNAKWNTGDDFEINQIAHFSVFERRHTERASTIITQLATLPLEQTIQSLANLRSENLDDMNFCEYIARRTFAKRKDTRNCVLPPPYQTNPSLFFTLELKPSGQVYTSQPTGTDLDPEHRLAWYREDVGLCVHHVNWHLAYPFREPKKHRQGELFAYMHEQMLARFDFERIAEGFDRVIPFGPGQGWDEEIPLGYNPLLIGFSFRPPSLKIATVNRDGHNVQKDQFELNQQRVSDSLERGWMEAEDGSRVEIDLDVLGCTLESNQGSANLTLYGNLHNNGHILIGFCVDPDGRFRSNPGAMTEDATAARDPMFYRWHKFLDNMFDTYRRSLPMYKSEDLLFRGIEITSLSTMSNREENEFLTYMENVQYEIYNVSTPNVSTPNGSVNNAVTKKALNHVPFKYIIKISNSTQEAQLVTIRIFIAPHNETNDLTEWKTMYVEMDKFVERVTPGNNTIMRSDKDSSVIVPSDTCVEDIRTGDFVPESKPNCGCGWPLPLLIPKGTTDGMKIQLFAIATNWINDRNYVSADLSGSVSYCGKSGIYPDKQPMGFPFDRSFAYPTIEDLVKDIPNSMVADAKITFIDKYQQYNRIKNVIHSRSYPRSRVEN